MSCVDLPFATAPRVGEIQYRFSGSEKQVIYTYDDPLRVSYQAADGSRRVVAGSRAAVIATLHLAGYQITLVEGSIYAPLVDQEARERKTRIWILGAPDPEMAAIERLLLSYGEYVTYALDTDGQRVRGRSAYSAHLCESSQPRYEHLRSAGGAIYLVECDLDDERLTPTHCDCSALVLHLDHHRPGDSGYGRPPSQYLIASAIGQVASRLGEPITPLIRYVAAADHCLGAAYRGECPGVDPEALMAWRAEQRAEHQRRSVDEVLADIASAHQVLLAAPTLELEGLGDAPHTTDHDWTSSVCEGCSDHPILARDLRGRHVPELPEAGTRYQIPYVADGLPDGDGRTKVVCSGPPQVVSAFLGTWAPRQGLTDPYGDPKRGFAGAYADAGRSS